MIDLRTGVGLSIAKAVALNQLAENLGGEDTPEYVLYSYAIDQLFAFISATYASDGNMAALQAALLVEESVIAAERIQAYFDTYTQFNQQSNIAALSAIKAIKYAINAKSQCEIYIRRGTTDSGVVFRDVACRDRTKAMISSVLLLLRDVDLNYTDLGWMSASADQLKNARIYLDLNAAGVSPLKVNTLLIKPFFDDSDKIAVNYLSRPYYNIGAKYYFILREALFTEAELKSVGIGVNNYYTYCQFCDSGFKYVK